MFSDPLANRSVHPTKWMTRLASEDVETPVKALVVSSRSDSDDLFSFIEV